MDHLPDRNHQVGPIGFTVLPLGKALDLIIDAATTLPGGHPGLAVHFCNAYNVALARTDPTYSALLERADVVFSDGVPITWVGRRAYPDLAPHWERVYGPDVMRGVLSTSTATDPRHYLLGGSPETLKALRTRIAAGYPQATIVGADSPPFRTSTEEELRERDERIRASGASIVWVGLGTPKQDLEVARLASRLPVVALAVGAAFDFLAGTKPQAPLWMQRSGTEWAFRLASEPRRLGRRYLWGNAIFAGEALRTLRGSRAAFRP